MRFAHVGGFEDVTVQALAWPGRYWQAASSAAVGTATASWSFCWPRSAWTSVNSLAHDGLMVPLEPAGVCRHDTLLITAHGRTVVEMVTDRRLGFGEAHG
jgi:hypothetical protein